MIRKASELAAALQSGLTVSRQKTFEGTGHVLCVSQTSEPVHGQAFNVLKKREQICVVSLDMCGEPLEYGIVTPA